MDKILELLKEMGISEELADSLVQQLTEWKETETTRIEEDFNEKLARAKKICMESVEKYQKDLARKVEIFMESKVASIERSARERQAIEESKAVNTLKQAKGILEGIEIDTPDAKDFQAVRSENEQLKRSLVSVTEDRDVVATKHKKAVGIAQSALQRNRLLEAKLAGRGETVAEDAPKKAKKKDNKGTILEDQRTKTGQPKTHRATLTESQVPAKKTTQTQDNDGDEQIMSIANAISDIP